MIIGTIFLGKVDELNDQWIETKFFILGIPLVPLKSVWVTSSGFRSRKGFPIELNTKSVIAAYSRVYLGLIAFLFILAGALSLVNLVNLFLGLLFTAAWCYFFFVYGKADQSGLAERKKLGSITGVYIHPAMMDYGHLYKCYERAESKYTSLFKSDWLQDASARPIEDEKLPLLHVLTYLNYQMANTNENKNLADKIELLLQRSKERKLAVVN